MKRALLAFAPLFLVAACEPGGGHTLTTSTFPPPGNAIPAVVVNDPCSAYATETDCQAQGGKCSWATSGVGLAGMSAQAAVCVTASACASLTTADACQANSNCAWAAIAVTGNEVLPLCPISLDNCSGGGYCFDRSPTGNSCHCLQPLYCSTSSCPPVQCDCPPPPATDGGVGSGGGGTCTCACPVCAPGEYCPPCDCSCGGGGTGGSGGGCGTVTGAGGSTGTGGSTGAGGGPGTCTCNCPVCPAGVACPACSCSCTNGSSTTMTVAPASSNTASASASTDGGSAPVSVCGCPACPANTACAPCSCGTTPPDPCSVHDQPASCAADTANSCGWISLNIECVTAPCPTGACARMSTGVTPDAGGSTGGGGCGCACPACTVTQTGQTCPPCACTCCPGPAPAPPVTLQPAGGAPSSGG